LRYEGEQQRSLISQVAARLDGNQEAYIHCEMTLTKSKESDARRKSEKRAVNEKQTRKGLKRNMARVVAPRASTVEAFNNKFRYASLV
jgi:hypothetical protein